MVKINRIYTRTGDDGTTGLVGGERVLKCSPRVEAYGSLDELNAWCGLVRTTLLARNESGADRSPVVAYLEMIQNELFDIGAELATPPSAQVKHLPEESAARLESWIDELNRGLPELRSFVLPGGGEVASFLHVARTVCRRVERHLVDLSTKDTVHTAVLIYLNRLSDLLFVMSRFETHRAGLTETLWVPEKKWPEESS